MMDGSWLFLVSAAKLTASARWWTRKVLVSSLDLHCTSIPPDAMSTRQLIFGFTTSFKNLLKAPSLFFVRRASLQTVWCLIGAPATCSLEARSSWHSFKTFRVRVGASIWMISRRMELERDVPLWGPSLDKYAQTAICNSKTNRRRSLAGTTLQVHLSRRSISTKGNDT